MELAIQYIPQRKVAKATPGIIIGLLEATLILFLIHGAIFLLWCVVYLGGG